MTPGRETKHDATGYERPTHPYVCGRAALWRAACWQGPGPDGACGGASECAPVRIGDRWECRRPKQAGGRCMEGPLPDGRCARRHVACVPATSLRRRRGRVSALVLIALLVVLIVGPDPTAESVVSPAAIDPGGLSSVHAGFTRDIGCAACHASHGERAGGWMAAALRDNDPSAKCLDCHAFAEPMMRAHNVVHPKRAALGEVSCIRCHTEHKGAGLALARVPDLVCANCHERRFGSFAAHPPFAERYPYTQPGAIYFDHAKHIKDYFSDPKHAKRSPEFAAQARSRCTVCHEVESASREVRPKAYADICAGCHEAQIQRAELILLEPERMTAAASVLLGLEKEGDWDEASKVLGKLFAAMAKSGTDALVAAAGGADRAARKRAAALFEGLPAPAVQAAGGAWAARKLLPPAEGEPGPGWNAGENAEGAPSLFYRPRGHADPVVRAWNEHLLAAAATRTELQGQIAADARDQFLDVDIGPGVCGKCHGAALRSGKPEAIGTAWRYAGPKPRPFVRYSHAPHLGLLDPEAGCRSCHVLNAASRYAKYHASSAPSPAAYESNFSEIGKEACLACHSRGHVDAACQVCHNYHKDHRLNLGFRQKSSAANGESKGDGK